MMDWSWEQEEYQIYLEELEQERWDMDSLTRMTDSAFQVSIELRRFMEFSDLVLRKELADAVPINTQEIWRELRAPSKHREKLNSAPLSRWLSRTNNLSQFIERTRRLLPADLPLEGRVLAIQALLRSWIDEPAIFALGRHTTWQGVIFFYSIESSLRSLVYLISVVDINSHAVVLNELQSLIIYPLKNNLFSPVDFLYTKNKNG